MTDASKLAEYLPKKNPSVKTGVDPFEVLLEPLLNRMLELANMYYNAEVVKAMYPPVNLACTVPAQCATVVLPPLPVKKEKGNKPMCYDCDYDDDCCSTDTVTEKKVNYLKGRAYRIRDDKQTELRKQFSMDADKAPETPEELIARFKEDRFTLVEKEKRNLWSGVYGSIIWKDPKVPADPVGYEAALKELDKSYQKIMDTIMIAEAADALKAVQDFEAS